MILGGLPERERKAKSPPSNTRQGASTRAFSSDEAIQKWKWREKGVGTFPANRDQRSLGPQDLHDKIPKTLRTHPLPKVGFKTRVPRLETEQDSRKARGRGIGGDPARLGSGLSRSGCRGDGGGRAEDMSRWVEACYRGGGREGRGWCGPLSRMP